MAGHGDGDGEEEGGVGEEREGVGAAATAEARKAGAAAAAAANAALQAVLQQPGVTGRLRAWRDAAKQAVHCTVQVRGRGRKSCTLSMNAVWPTHCIIPCVPVT